MNKGLLHGTYSTMVISKPLFLDLYPGAAVAYSFRKLRRDYRGFCLQVQHDDTTVLDIPFKDDYIDLEYARSFLRNSSNGYLFKWYDQSGNNNTANITGASVNIASSIYNKGFHLLNNKVVAFIQLNSYLLFTNNISALGDWSTFVVSKRTGAGVRDQYISGSAALSPTQWNDNNVYIQRANTGTDFYRSAADSTSTYKVMNGYCINNVMSAYKNNSPYSLAAELGFSGSNTVWNTIGGYNGISNPASARFGEVILYSKDMSSSRNEMNQNIMHYYGL